MARNSSFCCDSSNMLIDSEVVVMVRCGGWGRCLRTQVCCHFCQCFIGRFFCAEDASHLKLSYTTVTAVGFQY